VRPDRVMIHDAGGPRRLGPELAALGVDVMHPDKLIVVSDHYAPGNSEATAEVLRITREWARSHGVGAFFDMEGISHTLIVEKCLVDPGMLLIGGDSHTPTAGALGALAFGMGQTDMLSVLALGETWLEVPRLILVELHGELPWAVTAKDLVLEMIRSGIAGRCEGKVIEYRGEALSALDVEERSVLTNMATEMSAMSAVIPYDSVTAAHFRRAGREPSRGEDGGAGPAPEERVSLACGSVVPLVALPHSLREIAPAAELQGVAVSRAYIGACTGAKLADLMMAAEVLRGRRVADGVLLHVAPASEDVLRAATRNGTLEVLLESGAKMLPTGCGACPGFGNGLLSAGDVCISTTNRNFPGRMGSTEARVFLGSPWTVAASAVAGRVCDPREVAAERAG